MGETGAEIPLICGCCPVSSYGLWEKPRLVPDLAGGFSHLGSWPLGKWSWARRGGRDSCEVLDSHPPVSQGWFGKVLLKTDAVCNENHVSVEENCELVVRMLFLLLLDGGNSSVTGLGDLYVLLFQYLQH